MPLLCPFCWLTQCCCRCWTTGRIIHTVYHFPKPAFGIPPPASALPLSVFESVMGRPNPALPYNTHRFLSQPPAGNRPFSAYWTPCAGFPRKLTSPRYLRNTLKSYCYSHRLQCCCLLHCTLPARRCWYSQKNLPLPPLRPLSCLLR